MKWMDENLGGWKDAEEGARKMAREFVLPKLGRKPRDGGDFVNYTGLQPGAGLIKFEWS